MGMPYVWRSIDGTYIDSAAGLALDWDTAWSDAVHDHSSAAEGGTSLNLAAGTLVVPAAAAPAQTDDASVVWDSDDNLLTVGTGAGRKVMVDLDSTQTLAAKTLTTPTIGSFVNANHDHTAGAGGGLLDWDTVWTDAVHSHQSNAEGGALDGAAITTTITGTGNVVKATSPTVTTLTVSSGGLGVTGGITVTTGNLVITEGVIGQTTNGATTYAYTATVTSEGNPRFKIRTDGLLVWSDAAGSNDTDLYRSAADMLKTDDSLTVLGSFTLSGALDHDGSTAGFYGTAPASKPTVSGSRGGNAALASLLSGLAGLGLLTDSSTA